MRTDFADSLFHRPFILWLGRGAPATLPKKGRALLDCQRLVFAQNQGALVKLNIHLVSGPQMSGLAQLLGNLKVAFGR